MARITKQSLIEENERLNSDSVRDAHLIETQNQSSKELFDKNSGLTEKVEELERTQSVLTASVEADAFVIVKAIETVNGLQADLDTANELNHQLASENVAVREVAQNYAQDIEDLQCQLNATQDARDFAEQRLGLFSDELDETRATNRSLVVANEALKEANRDLYTDREFFRGKYNDAHDSLSEIRGAIFRSAETLDK